MAQAGSSSGAGNGASNGANAALIKSASVWTGQEVVFAGEEPVKCIHEECRRTLPPDQCVLPDSHIQFATQWAKDLFEDGLLETDVDYNIRQMFRGNPMAALWPLLKSSGRLPIREAPPVFRPLADDESDELDDHSEVEEDEDEDDSGSEE